MMKEVLFNDEEYGEILQHLQHLMAEADSLPYPNAKDLIFSILKYFDSIHREPLSRMMDQIRAAKPELGDQLETDFTVRTMLGLYDLVAKKEESAPPENGNAVGFVAVEDVTLLNPIPQKEWLELGHIDDFVEQKLYAKNYEQLNFLVVKLQQQEVYALENQCIGSILPLDRGRLEDHQLVCPWHGCRYDLSTGVAIEDAQKKLATYATEIDEDGLLKVEIVY